MIPGPSIVILDNNHEHLQLLTNALHKGGYATLPVLFEEGKPQIPKPLNSIQVLFLDIRLIHTAPLGPQTYDIVAGALEDLIAPDNGPYILVTWSTYGDAHNELMKHLSDNLTDDFPVSVASGFLDKNLYLGAGQNSDLMQDAIKSAASIPQVNALLEWCNAGRIAAGEVTNSLLRLVPKQDRYLGESGSAIERLLSSIALEGSGANAEDNLTSAMNDGLGPILMDRLLHSTAVPNNMEEKWEAAITKPLKSKLETNQALELNTMASISSHDIEGIVSGGRGSVYKFRDDENINDVFKKYFGCTEKDLLPKFADLKCKEDRELGELSKPEKKNMRNKFLEKSEFRLVELSAACDHVWKKVPVKKLLLALEMPIEFDGNFCKKEGGAIYASPKFISPHKGQGVKLIFNWRYYFSSPENLDWEVIYRLREPLITHISTAYHIFGFRPGIPNYR